MEKMGKTSALMVISVIIGLILLGVIAFGVYQGVIKEPDTSVEGGCEQTPIFDVDLVDTINPGTSLNPDQIYASKNGIYIGNITASGSSTATQFGTGDKVEIMINETDYINKILGTYTVGCGVNSVKGDLYKTSTNTFRIFNTDNNLMTDNIAGGVTNQSESASPINMEIKIDSSVDEGTGDLIIVIEATNTTEVDQITLSGLGGVKDVDTPEFYTLNVAGSIVEAFEVSGLIDGETKSGTLTLSPESGETMGEGGDTNGMGVYVTAYSIQSFVDKDGTFQTGVEDADGNVKYEDTWDYDFMLHTA